MARIESTEAAIDAFIPEASGVQKNSFTDPASMAIFFPHFVSVENTPARANAS
jgi:hypothetical protein